MKKLLCTLLLTILCFISCSSDSNDNYTDEQKTLMGTTWTGEFEGELLRLTFTALNDATLTVTSNDIETDWKVRYEFENPPLINMYTSYSPTGIIIGTYDKSAIDVSYTSSDVILYQLKNNKSSR